MVTPKKYNAPETWPIRLLTAAVALVFFWAAYHMVADWAAHRRHMDDQVFSPWWTGAMVWILPIGYGLVGGALSYRPFQRAACWVALSYVLLLSTYILLAMGNAFDTTPCSCIGFRSGSTFQTNLKLNTSMVVLILLAIALERGWLATIRMHVSARRPWRRKEAARHGE